MQSIQYKDDDGVKRELQEFFRGKSQEDIAAQMDARWLELSQELDDATVTRRVEITERQYKGRHRNKPCNCGSGKKFKKCCMRHRNLQHHRGRS